MYQLLDDENQAYYTFTRAAEIVQPFATGIKDEQKRTQFLKARQVRHVLERASG